MLQSSARYLLVFSAMEELVSCSRADAYIKQNASLNMTVPQAVPFMCKSSAHEKYVLRPVKWSSQNEFLVGKLQK